MSATTQMFKLVDIPGKGMGVVATCAIKRGTVIIDESAAIDSETPVDAGALEPAENEDDLAAEHRGSVQDVRIITHLISNSAQAPDIMQLADSGEGRLGKTAYGVFMTNALPKGANTRFGALFLTCSRFNHSCTPNAYHSYLNDRNVQRVYVVRDIAEGDEICTSYIDMVATRDERAGVLMRRFGFACVCATCVKADPLSDQRRSKMQLIDKVMSRPANPRIVFKSGHRYQTPMHEEDLAIHPLLKRFHYDMFQLAVLMKDIVEARRRISKVITIAQLIDSEEEIGRYEQYRKNPQSWME